MVVIINMEIEEVDMKKINAVLAWLFIIQIPTAFVKYLIYGQGERAIGTYAMWGGGASTSLPLISIGFLIAIHFIYKKSLVNFALALGFIVFTIVGGKRAFIFYLPALFLFLSWGFRNRIRNFLKYFLLAVFLFLASFYFAVKLVPTLNPEREVWGSFDPNYVIDYAITYSTAEQKGKARGRVSATRSIYDFLKRSGIQTTLLGFGPGRFMKSVFEPYDTRYTKQTDELGVEYGITGLSWLALQVGYLGGIVWLSFIVYAVIRTYTYFVHEKDKYWRAFYLGMTSFSFLVLLMSITYDTVLIIDDTFSLVYMILLGFSVKRGMVRESSWRVMHPA
jgi:hypothetical protein